MKDHGKRGAYFGKSAYDKKKEQVIRAKRNEKSSMLRKYAKLCKKEGIVSDRINTESRTEETKTIKKPKKEKVAKPNPFAKSMATAKANKDNKTTAQNEKDAMYAQNDKDKAEAIKAREKNSKLLSKKTKKGQPVLGNHIQAILNKLQKDKA
jgi:hypothetical protein